ncbi:MAG: hypothetical protein ACI9UA_005475 [Pseudoalteromonas tetraodonis]|jgi:hypothetical protein
MAAVAKKRSEVDDATGISAASATTASSSTSDRKEVERENMREGEDALEPSLLPQQQIR